VPSLLTIWLPCDQQIRPTELLTAPCRAPRIVPFRSWTWPLPFRFWSLTPPDPSLIGLRLDCWGAHQRPTQANITYTVQSITDCLYLLAR
jgi:hypothetical protein